MNSEEQLKQNIAMGQEYVEKIWDMWRLTLGSFSWSQEQIEKVAEKYFEQQKMPREEQMKIIEELMNQAQKNQSQMQKMIEEAVIGAFENIKMPYSSTIDELTKKVEELSKKIETL